MTDSKDDKRAEDDPRFKKVGRNLLRTTLKPHKDEEPKHPPKVQERREK
ncbi:hypothetical protein [Thalassobaculum sp.]